MASRPTALLGGLLLLLAGCGTTPHPDRYRVHHTVVAGETLYAIAWRYGNDFQELADWNGIAAPYAIYPGQQLLVIEPTRELATPSTTVKVFDRGRPVGSPDRETAPQTQPAATAATRPTPRPAPVSAAAKPAPKPASTKAPSPAPVRVTWRWPTTGKVIQRFKPNDGKKGIDIRGMLGQPVEAAAAGEVVYSGDGLKGYGNLIIVKHNDEFLSAYGHNRKLLAKEGDRVASGQQIAEMGQTGKDGSILHFEIRRKGRPVDPVLYLPRQ